MYSLFKFLLRVVSGLLVLAAVFSALAVYLATRSLPDYDATHAVDKIGAPVEIIRDTANVPHIYGETDRDVFFAQGFAHAQDRLFQMVLQRRAVEGKLAEVFGERALESDILMRHLGLYRAAEKSLAAQSPQIQDYLQAYADGVNAWLFTVNEQALGRGAPEFFLFPGEIAYWRPADSIALLKLLAFEFNDEPHNEVLRARLSLVLSPERLADILPDDPSAAAGLIPNYQAYLGAELPSSQLATIRNDAFAPTPQRGFGGASNMFVAGSERAAAGANLMATDPHSNLQAPASFYLNHLHLSNGGVIGASVPGVPGMLFGRGAKIGWGVTYSGADASDLYVEAVDEQNTENYMRNGRSVPFERRQSIIRIKDAQPISLSVRATDRGPVLPPAAFNVASVTPKDHVMSLSWTALSAADTSVSGMINGALSRTLTDLENAAEQIVAPALNVTLTDAGTAIQILVGDIPRRASAHQSQGRLPSPSSTGVLYNTNNKVSDAPFPAHISFDSGDTQRVQRVRRLLQSREIHSRESFIAIQNDNVSPAARTLLPLIGAELWFTGEAASEGTIAQDRARALKLLSEWNGDMSQHLAEPLIYSAWLSALNQRLIRDELGATADAFTLPDPIFVERVFRDVDGASIWCDIVQSAPLETCDVIARLALDDALVWLKENFGGTLESLRWGDAHVARHAHPVLGDIPLLSWIVNIDHPTSGGDYTLNRGLTRGTGDKPFDNINGASYRGVYDFADPDSSLFIIPTGQSGHPLSRHYDDLGTLWRQGEYVTMSMGQSLSWVCVPRCRPRRKSPSHPRLSPIL